MSPDGSDRYNVTEAQVEATKYETELRNYFFGTRDIIISVPDRIRNFFRYPTKYETIISVPDRIRNYYFGTRQNTKLFVWVCLCGVWEWPRVCVNAFVTTNLVDFYGNQHWATCTGRGRRSL